MFKAQIIGNLTDDPQVSTNGDTTFCNFTIAENNRRTGKVDYINVVAFNNLANVCNDYLQKGSQVFVSVEGVPRASAYIDKDGNAKSSIKYPAKEVEFLSKIKSKEHNKSSIDQAIGNIPEQNKGNRSNSHNDMVR